MSWFGILQNSRDAKESLVLDGGDASSPTEWELLSQGEVGEREMEIPTDDTGDGSVSDDETLTVIEAEEDTKTQVDALRKQLGVSLGEKQSIEARLRQQDNAVDALKEKSNRVAARMQAELNEAHQDVQKHQSAMDGNKQKLEKMQEEMKAVAEESHQAQVRARLEMKGTRLMLEEKTQQMTKAERNNEILREELGAAKEQIDQLVPGTRSLKENLAQTQESNVVLEEQSRSLKKEILLLREESSRLAMQNSQVLAMLGVRTLEREEAHAFAAKPDLVSDAVVLKMLEELNAEIFETAAYMADSFTFSIKQTKTDDMRDAYSRATKMLGSAMVLSLTSVRHDDDPLIVQIACQACMVECCRRIISSWCFDGSKAEEALPDIYNRIRKTEAHAGAISGRWRALTRTLVRSMLHGQTGDMSSRLVSSIFDAIVDALLVAGCQGTTNQIRQRLTARFSMKMTVLTTMSLRLNEVIGEEITSCELKAISMPYGVAFSARTMDDGYDDGKWHGLPSESPQVLCTTELGLQKEVKRYDDEKVSWQRVVLAKPKVSLESLTNGMQLRDVRGTYTVCI